MRTALDLRPPRSPRRGTETGARRLCIFGDSAAQGVLLAVADLLLLCCCCAAAARQPYGRGPAPQPPQTGTSGGLRAARGEEGPACAPQPGPSRSTLLNRPHIIPGGCGPRAAGGGPDCGARWAARCASARPALNLAADGAGGAGQGAHGRLRVAALHVSAWAGTAPGASPTGIRCACFARAGGGGGWGKQCNVFCTVADARLLLMHAMCCAWWCALCAVQCNILHIVGCTVGLGCAVRPFAHFCTAWGTVQHGSELTANSHP